MTVIALLPQILLVLGVGFLIANARVGVELLRWLRRRKSALVTWPARKPPYYGLSLGIGVMLGLLILLKAYLAMKQLKVAGQPLPLGDWFLLFGRSAFGELMMFVYFGYMLPFSTRITRGLYAEGIWTDTGFMPYNQIGGISWREGENPTLIIISRLKTLARRLLVPGPALGEVRRHLRDKISAHAIPIDEGPGLHLGVRDARDVV
jgi:hypothetical protein